MISGKRKKACLLFLLQAICFVFLTIYPFDYNEIKEIASTLFDGLIRCNIYPDIESLDDQRSTLWPLLVSALITMLGTVVTSYIFLKDSLDRTEDERPYYRKIIQNYRDDTVQHLMRYTGHTLGMFAAVSFIYVALYYMQFRVPTIGRCITIGGLVMLCTRNSYRFLKKCIRIQCQLVNASEQLRKSTLKNINRISNKLDAPLRRYLSREDTFFDDFFFLEWCSIYDSSEKLDRNLFVKRFANWEKLLLLAIEGDLCDGQKKQVHSIVQQIKSSMKYQPTEVINNIEQQDIKDHSMDVDVGSCGFVLNRIQENEENVDIASIYELLSDFRDCCVVQGEILRKDLLAKEGEHRNRGEHVDEVCVGTVFCYFLLMISVQVLTILPKVNVFAPAERFWFANFYNTRFENSAFRSSVFQNSVFARSKILNSNFNLSRFEYCSFFSSVCSDCSFSNAVFISSDFKEAIFENVDFTGAILDQCRLEFTKICNSIVSNMAIELSLNGCCISDFSNTKISEVVICCNEKEEVDIRKCNFSNCSIHKVQLDIDYKEYDDCVDESDPWLQSLYNFLNDKKLWNLFYKNNPKCESDNKKYDYKTIRTNAVEMNNNMLSQEGCESFQSRTVVEHGHYRTPESNHIWKQIEEMTVINLSESVFDHAEIDHCLLLRANVSQGVFNGAIMNDAVLIGITFVGAVMPEINLRNSIISVSDMSRCVLTNCILYGSACTVVNFEDNDLSLAHASKANFKYCSFARSDCSKIDLTNASLSRCSFADSIMNGAELTEARFEFVNFENSLACDMLSSFSSFESCNFMNATLTGSNLNDTIFLKCDLVLMCCQNSTIVNAVFQECDFKNSNFRNDCFIRVKFSGNKNLQYELFEDAKFIGCIFEEGDEEFEKILIAHGAIIRN